MAERSQLTGGTPMDDRKRRVLQAHDQFLDSATAFLQGVPINVGGKPGQ